MAADLVLLNARMRTLDPVLPFAEAVAVRDGWVVAVGAAAQVRSLVDASAEVLDAAGGAVVPGLVDAHVHPFRGTDATRGLDLSAVGSIDDLRELLARARRALPDGAWLTGHGLPYEPFTADGIRADAIEAALGGAPAALRFFDMHTMLASARALELAGIDGPRAFAERAEVVCDAGGRPTGELREWAAVGLMDAAIPEPAPAERRAAHAATLRAMNAAGLTGAHVMLGDEALLDAVADLESEGLLTLRVRVPLWVSPGVTGDELDALAAHRDRCGRRWTAGVVKLFADGVVEAGTAWLHEPDVFGANVQPFWPEPGAYAAAVRRMAGHGFQCVTHCVGDGAVRAALDAYAGAPRAVSGAPHRIEHVETLRDEELGRLAPEGVAASMQPVHFEGLDTGDPDDAWRRAVGDDRLRLAFRWADIRRSGAILALGSDWNVADFDPRLGMAWARLRRDPREAGRRPFGPDQSLTGLQALEGYTTHAALAAGEQALGGRIAPGMRADLTVLAEDPVDLAAEELPDLPVVATVVDGEVVYRAG